MTLLVPRFFLLYRSLFLPPPLPGTLGEREGESESQRIDHGRGSTDSNVTCAADHGLYRGLVYAAFDAHFSLDIACSPN